jgi:hypothetical protein
LQWKKRVVATAAMQRVAQIHPGAKCATQQLCCFFSSSAPARRKMAAAQINYRTRTREREREKRRAMPSAFVIIFGQIFAALPHLLPLDLSRPFCQIFTSIYRKERQSLFSLSLMPVSYNWVAALCWPTKRGARTLSKKYPLRGEQDSSHSDIVKKFFQPLNNYK